MRNVKLLEVASEIGAGTRGASLGIDALKIAALDYMSSFFVNFPSEKVETFNHLLYEPVSTPYAKRAAGVLETCTRVAAAVKETLTSGLFPIVLAGDHSSALGTIAGIRLAHPKRRLGTIWIDAHADMHTPYTTPSGNMHGMPLGAALGLDNKAEAVHKLDSATESIWEKLKNLGGKDANLRPEDLVFIALRDYEKEEENLIKSLNIKVIPVSEVRRKGVENVIRQTLMHLSTCDDIYVSFDVDSMDSAISRGTGTPVSNGLKEREAEDLLAALMQNRKICCLEVTEVNPTLDKENLMAEITFNILQRSVNVLLLN